MRRSRPTRLPFRLATLIALLLAFAAVPAVASAADRYVAVDGADDSECLDDAHPCKTIQYAVDVSDADDTVNVGAGTYSESVVVPLPLTIVGPFDCGCPGSPDPDEELDDSARGGAGEARIVGVGDNPAVEVVSEDVSLVGLAFGPAAGPASGVGVQFRSGAADGAVAFSLFEHLVDGIKLDAVDGVQVFFNVFRDQDDDAGRAISGDGDNGSVILENLFRRNTRAIELNESTETAVAYNFSRGDGTFVVSSFTELIAVWFNDVENVQTAGITLNAGQAPDIEGNLISGEGSGLELHPSSGVQVTDPTIEINDFHDLGGSGLIVADDAIDELELHGNRFFATGGAGLLVEGGPGVSVDATDNWWGCNEGPGQDGCDEYAAPGGAEIDADPWTVMTLDADDAAIPTGGASTLVTASFNTNSDGDDIFPQGIADDLVVAFSTTLGTVDPEEDCTCGGESLTDLISGDEPGMATVTASLDAESVTTQVEFLGPWARIAPDGFDFGPVAFGAFSPQQKFTVKNTGNENLDITGVSIGGPNAPDFQLTQDGCTDQLLAPGEFCAVKARFVPTGSGDGPREATLVVDSNVPAGSTEAELTGTATGSSVLRVTPDPFSFGEVPVGSVSSQQKFTARNITDANVTIDDVSLGGDDPSQFDKTADTCTGETLAPGETCIVRARFAPTAGGGRTAALQFDVAATTVATAELSGTASTVADVRINPATFSFGDVAVGQKSPYQKWTVKNTGGTPITVESVDLQGDDVAQFQRAAYGCADVVLQPGEYCTLKVRFRPTGAPGPRAIQLVVSSDVPGTHTAELTGNAVGL